VPTVLLCRTDAFSAQLLTSDIDERDRPFITGERTPEGFFCIRQQLGLEYAIARSLAFAPYSDLLWWETSEPDLTQAERFADAIHREFPDKMLVQLLSELQLAKDAGALEDRQLSARHRSNGLPLPVRNIGRLSQPQSVDV